MLRKVTSTCSLLLALTGCASIDHALDNAAPKAEVASEKWAEADKTGSTNDYYLWNPINPGKDTCYDKTGFKTDAKNCDLAKSVLRLKFAVNPSASSQTQFACKNMSDVNNDSRYYLAEQCAEYYRSALKNFKDSSVLNTYDNDFIKSHLPITFKAVKSSIESSSKEDLSKNLAEAEAIIKSEPAKNTSSAEDSEKIKREFRSYFQQIQKSLGLSEKELGYELVRGDGVGGIGFALGEVLFRIHKSSLIDDVKSSAYSNKAGRHILIDGVSAYTNQKVQIHFIVEKKYAVLLSIRAGDNVTTGAEAVMLLAPIISELEE